MSPVNGLIREKTTTDKVRDALRARELAMSNPEICSEYRCETCTHFIAKMKNCFGVEQPFCRNPVMIEFYRNLPEDPGTTGDGQHFWLRHDKILKDDNWYHPMDECEVRGKRIMGCLSHSRLMNRGNNLKDITGAKFVQVEVSRDNKVLWVNTEDGCVLRICQIEHLCIGDKGVK